jgi:hypothetical protein
MFAGELSATPIKQDLVGSCAVIASLCVAAEYERKFRTPLISARISPRDAKGRFVNRRAASVSVRSHLRPPDHT